MIPYVLGSRPHKMKQCLYYTGCTSIICDKLNSDLQNGNLYILKTGACLPGFIFVDLHAIPLGFGFVDALTCRLGTTGLDEIVGIHVVFTPTNLLEEDVRPESIQKSSISMMETMKSQICKHAV